MILISYLAFCNREREREKNQHYTYVGMSGTRLIHGKKGIVFEYCG